MIGKPTPAEAPRPAADRPDVERTAARKKQPSELTLLFTAARVARLLAQAALGAFVGEVLGRLTKGKRRAGVARLRRPAPTTEAVAPEPPALLPATPEPRGSARDERSFEQRRRGGPVTGEAPPKIHGPRHTGGGRRRGRTDGELDEDEAIFPDLPIFDYDELPAREIEARIDSLEAPDVRVVLAYETRNKHRKSVIEAIERRLAG